MSNILRVLLSSFFVSGFIYTVFELNKSTDSYLYGKSYRQNKLVNTIRLHKYGITGRGIRVGIIDAGFYALHPAFKNTRIIKEYDFVSGKSSTLDYTHKKGLDHGTNVLSVIGGYRENELIGIAYGADYVLAKTDISTDRLTAEEENAAKASKWLFDNRVQIITTSLSFNKFDDADYYYPKQMNGRTALITRTADSLVEKGVVYVCSAGNNYEEDWHIIEPPGDGFKVLTTGSVDKHFNHSWFSSCGPTVDGRIKPDIVTPGEAIWNANYLPTIKPDFFWNHGTSLSAPIAAGIAALILSVHPNLTSENVVEAIKKSSSKADSPDNLSGWGVPDAEKAVSYFGPAFSNVPELIDYDNKLEIRTHVFSIYGLERSSIELHLIEGNGKEKLIIKMKEESQDYYVCTVEIGLVNNNIRFFFKAEDKRGNYTKYPSGIKGEYFNFRDINGKSERETID